MFNFVRKKLFILVMFCLSVSTGYGVRLEDYSPMQQTKAALAVIKAFARFGISEQGFSLDERKAALVSNAIATLAHTTGRVLDGERDWVSKSAHANVAIWQFAKQVEEYLFLKGAGKKSHGLASLVELKKRYHGALSKDSANQDSTDNLWWQKNQNKSFNFKRNLKRGLRWFFIAADLTATLWATHDDGENRKVTALAHVAQSFADLGYRYLSRDGQFKSEKLYGKIEMGATAAPLVYDLFGGGYKFFVPLTAIDVEIEENDKVCRNLETRQDRLARKIKEFQGDISEEEALRRLRVEHEAVTSELNRVRENDEKLRESRDSLPDEEPYDLDKDGCPICFCNFKNGESIVKAPCNGGHLFCERCLNEWINRPEAEKADAHFADDYGNIPEVYYSADRNRCPACNEDVTWAKLTTIVYKDKDVDSA